MAKTMKTTLPIMFLILSGCAANNRLAAVSRLEKSFGSPSKAALVASEGISVRTYEKDGLHVRVISKDGLAVYVRYLRRESPWDGSDGLQNLTQEEISTFLAQCDPQSAGWNETPSKSFRNRYWKRNDGRAEATYNLGQLHVMTSEWLKRGKQKESASNSLHPRTARRGPG